MGLTSKKAPAGATAEALKRHHVDPWKEHQMPKVSVASPTGPTSPAPTSRVTFLAKQVETRGLCRSARVTPENDPWFPATETGDKAAALARRACAGCPVVAECRAVAYREESTFGDVWGVRGGLSAGERRDLLRARHAVGGAR